MTWGNGQTLYCVFLALEVASDPNLPWQQALKTKTLTPKDTVSAVVVAPAHCTFCWLVVF